MGIETLDLSAWTFLCLKRSGIDTVEQLLGMDDEDLMELPYVYKSVFVETTEKMRKFKEKRCKVCVDLDRIYDIVCYIPTDNGGSIDLPVHYCPQCGRKLNT